MTFGAQICAAVAVANLGAGRVRGSGGAQKAARLIAGLIHNSTSWIMCVWNNVCSIPR
jgi:hypothetical protein